MKKIINFALNNKFAIWILTVLVIVTGLYSGLNMKQEAMPNITMPNISIMTTYPGAAPDEVAEKVTEPIEQVVQNLKGVETVSSSSMANASSIQMEFDFDTNMDDALNEVKEAVADAKLPDGAKDPEVSRINLNAFPVIALSVSDADHSLEELTNTVEKDIVPSLKGIDGVSDVQVTGQQLQKVTIDFDQKKLAKYGLTEDKVAQIIQGSDMTYPMGLNNFDGEVKNLVIDGKAADIKDLKALKIPYTPQTQMGADQGQAAGQMQQGQMQPDQEQGAQQGADQAAGQSQMPGVQAGQNGADVASQAAQAQMDIKLPTVSLDKIAHVKLVQESESISRTNGEDSIGIQVVKASEANTVDVVNDVKDKMDDFEKDLGITSTATFDQGQPIEESVSTMLDKALFGILFAVIIILLFLRSFKTTIISIISIPLSLLIAIFALHYMDISLNILTLGALTVAIGRVIDDSIVVMENIYRRMSLPDEKLHGKELVREATRQMFIPIMSSTIVTIAVFLPMGLIHGQVGELFMPFALAVVFALAASLLVAITVVPMLAHSLFKKQLNNETSQSGKARIEKKPSRLAKVYRNVLEWALNHKIITFGGAVVVLVLSLFLLPVIGVNFLADEEQKMVMATYTPEPGETHAKAKKITSDAEKLIGERKGITKYQYSLGGDSPLASMGMGGDNAALFFIEYDKDYKHFDKESTQIIKDLNKQTDIGEWKSMDFDSMGSGLELYVYGDNLEDIQKTSDKVEDILKDNKDLEKVDSSISEAYDQYTLVTNQKKLSQYGLTTAQIGMALANGTEGSPLTTVKHDGEDVNVYVEVEKKEYKSIKDLTNKEIDTPLGTKVKVGDVVDVKEGKSPDTVQRRDGKMYASVKANIKTKDAGGVSQAVQKKIDQLDVPDGVKVEFGGITEEINDSFTQLGLAMLAAIAIVYFVLVVTFHGALAPFAIIFSLPFAIIGSLVALWIAGEPLSVSAMIGALMLIGIVVTNAIVLVDRVIHKENEGLSTREALLEAGTTRLRPILMTALATVGALIPLAIGMEGGGLISKGLGITVIGGLISSTLLTLVIVPIVYEVLAKSRRKEN
ncbi:efflux RND transporter permease subunit [Virgibacillus sp. 179-BFC.A HS]|uniref:Efflux RND transporter permease subunit n=1 Tax=Tigheibacillus jepli TaxID=3035914 RepID=A0ABU5CEQ4_9BACI|nr:efflux RND transporter permease subunit [Virgibacillus sp. 179-BFC.A HS]MDY0404309.1 efflux RND transporter permease subunit [Virgibacillus sp. 179-BFC.A HS]